MNKKRDPRRNTVLFFLRLRNETLGSSLQGNKYGIIGGRDIRSHSRLSCLMLFLMCSFKEALEIRKSPRPSAPARTFLLPGGGGVLYSTYILNIIIYLSIMLSNILKLSFLASCSSCRGSRAFSYFKGFLERTHKKQHQTRGSRGISYFPSPLLCHTYCPGLWTRGSHFLT